MDKSEALNLKTFEQKDQADILYDSVTVKQTPANQPKVSLTQVSPISNETRKKGYEKIREGSKVPLREDSKAILPDGLKEENLYFKAVKAMQRQELIDEDNMEVLNNLVGEDADLNILNGNFIKPQVIEVPGVIEKDSYNPQFMASPCGKYTLYSAIPPDEGAMPTSVIYSNETFAPLRVFSQFGHASFIPESSVIVGVLQKDEEEDQTKINQEEAQKRKWGAGVKKKDDSQKEKENGPGKAKVAAYDLEKKDWINKNFSLIQSYGVGGGEQAKTKPAEGEDEAAQDVAAFKVPQNYANYFSCYISDIMFGKAINVNPLQDITGVVFGTTKIKNGRLRDWCGRMIFYYGEPRKYNEKTKIWEEKEVDPKDCEINIDATGLGEFADQEELTIFLLYGGYQLAVYGLLADKIKKGIVIYEIKLVKNKTLKEGSTVTIRDIKISKRINFPDEVANQKDKILLEVDPYDPMMTASTHIPNLLVSKNQSEYHMLDFRKRQPKLVLKADSHEVQSISSYGRKSQCLMGMNKTKGIKIWVKKSVREEEENNPYAELFDIDVADVDKVHFTPDLRQLWLCINEDNKRHLKMYQINLVNNPHIRTHKYVNQLKSETRYLTDGCREIFVDNSNIVYINLSDQQIRRLDKPLKAAIGDDVSNKLLHSVSASCDFKTFYLMFLVEKFEGDLTLTDIFIYKVNDKLEPVLQGGKDGLIMTAPDIQFNPEAAFLFGQFAFIPDSQKVAAESSPLYRFKNIEAQGADESSKAPRLDEKEIKDFQFGLIDDVLVFCDIKKPNDKGEFNLYVLHPNGSYFTVPSGKSVAPNLLAQANLANSLISNRYGNKSRLVVYTKKSYGVIDLSRSQGWFIRAEAVTLMSRPELSPSGRFVCYIDEAFRVKMVTLDKEADPNNPKETHDPKLITTLDRATNFDLRYIEEEIDPQMISSKLAILYSTGTGLQARIWCLDTNRWLYRLFADSPYQIEINLVANYDMTKCCYFSRTGFELVYFNQQKKTQMQLHYDLGYKSKFYSGKILPLLMKSYFASESEGDREDIVDRMKAYINMIYPNIYGEIKSVFSMLYNLNEIEVFKTFLQNIQTDMLFYECRLFNTFFKYGEANESRQAIYEAAEEEAMNDEDNHVVNPQETEEFLAENHQKQMTNQLSRDMFALLLQSQIDENIICELPDKQARSFYIPPKSEDADFDIWHEVQTLKTKLQALPAEDYTTYEVYRSLAKLDLSTGSKACTNLFLTMSKLSDEVIEVSMLPLIYYKWNYSYWFALPFSLLYWTMAICAYVFLGFFPEQIGLAVVVCSLNVLFFAYEIKCAVNLGFKNHLKDPWNWADLIVLAYCFGIVVLCLILQNNINNPYMVWLRIFAASAVWIRAITWLRVFGPTRYLITMVFQVFIDMIPFLVVFITAIIIYTFIWRLSPLLEDPLPQSTLEPDGFYNTLYIPVMLIFGNGQTGEKIGGEDVNFSIIRFGINIVGNVVLSLCFLNFLIAIISGTYEKVNEKKDLYDVKELLNMIIEFNAFLENIICKSPRPSYFITLHPKVTTEEGLQQLEDKVTKLGEGLKKQIQKVEENLTERMYSKFEKMDDEVKALFKELTSQVRSQFEKNGKN